MAEPSPESVHEETREIWNANAGFWDDHMGAEGNDWHRELVAPAAERLLALQPEEQVLEIACGAGIFARRMAEQGASVVATDFCEAFLERARHRTASHADRVEIRLVDATRTDHLLALGERRFDAAVCSMSLMDMSDIGPLFGALARLLRAGGRFVFTVCHPCFHNSGCTRVVEQADVGDRVVTTYSIRVSRYRTSVPTLGIGVPGQPRPQYYFDRPLSDLLNAAFRAGFVLDGIEEPVFGEPSEADSALSARHFREFPLVLAARVRLPQ